MSVSTLCANDLVATALEEVLATYGLATGATGETLHVEGFPSVRGKARQDGLSTLEAPLGRLFVAPCAKRVLVPLLHPLLRVEGFATVGTREAAGVVRSRAKLHPLADDRPPAVFAALADPVDVTRAAEETVLHLVELPVRDPGLAPGAPEALGVPAPRLVLQVAHGRADGRLAAEALADRLHALAAEEVAVDQVEVRLTQVLPAALAREARLVPRPPLVREPARADADRLAALLALGGVPGAVAALADEPVVLHGAVPLAPV